MKWVIVLTILMWLLWRRERKVERPLVEQVTSRIIF